MGPPPLRLVTTLDLDLDDYELDFVGGEDHIYFTVEDRNEDTTEVWASDGTALGTLRVSRLPVDEEDIDIDELTVVGDRLFYATDWGAYGDELWTSEGTRASTKRVLDINPGSADSRPERLSVIDGKLWFGADDGFHASELWRSDGTAAGTVPVADVNTVGAGSFPDPLGTLDGEFFFSANDAVHGSELYKSDGTPSGTALLKDINTGGEGSSPFRFVVDGDEAYFGAERLGEGRELWRTDGTASGTDLVADLVPGAVSSEAQPLGVVDGKVIVAGYRHGDEDAQEGVDAIYASDGTAAGSVKISSARVESDVRAVVLDDELYFAATDDDHGTELWKTDGTPGGTVMVKNLRHQNYGSYPNNLIVFDGEVFFGASSDVDGDGDVVSDGGPDQADTGVGTELWKTDGTAAGTELVEDLRPGMYSGDPRYMVVFAGKLYFQSNGNGVQELWSSDGTAAGTNAMPGFEAPENLTVSGGTLFFSAVTSANGRELWKSDGTPGGASLVKDILPGPDYSFPSGLTEHAGRLWFRAGDQYSQALWSTDGTTAGTAKVQEFVPSAYLGGLRVAGGELFFVADDGRGSELWSTAAAATDPGPVAPGGVTCVELRPDPAAGPAGPTEPGPDPEPVDEEDPGEEDPGEEDPGEEDPGEEDPGDDPGETPDPGTGGGDTTPKPSDGGGGGTPTPGAGTPTPGGGSTPPANPPANPPAGPSDGDIKKALGGLASFKVGSTSVTFSQKFLVPGTVEWKLTMTKGSKTVTLGTAKKTVTKAGKAKVAITLTRSGRALLKRTRRARLKVTTKFKTSSGRTVTVATNKRGR